MVGVVSMVLFERSVISFNDMATWCTICNVLACLLDFSRGQKRGMWLWMYFFFCCCQLLVGVAQLDYKRDGSSGRKGDWFCVANLLGFMAPTIPIMKRVLHFKRFMSKPPGTDSNAEEGN